MHDKSNTILAAECTHFNMRHKSNTNFKLQQLVLLWLFATTRAVGAKTSQCGTFLSEPTVITAQIYLQNPFDFGFINAFLAPPPTPQLNLAEPS